MNRTMLGLSALALFMLALLTQAFFPTEPVGAMVLRGVFLSYALVCVVKAFGPTRPTPPRPLWRRLLPYLPLAMGLGFVVGHTLIVLFIFIPEVLAAALVGLITLAIGLALAVTRYGAPMTLVRGALALVTLSSGLAYIPVCLWLWSRPDPGLCEAAEAHPAVMRLTPPSYPEGRSFPYEMTYREESGHLAAAFKMAGNLSLGIWGDEAANRLAVIDVSDPDAPQLAELNLEGDPLPQYMTLGPQRDELVISRPGYGEHYLDYVDLSAFPKLSLTKRVETVPQPHAIALIEGPRLVLATMHREVLTLDYASAEVVAGTPIPNLLFNPGITITDMALSPDRTRAYLAMFGRELVEIDLRTRQGALRVAQVGFGAGEVTHHPSAPLLYQTDFFQNLVRVIDTDSLETLSTWPLDFAPRPVAIAPKRDLVAIGDWLRGVVHFKRASTGAPIAEPLEVGPYLREFAIDDARGLLFTASKCGVYRIDLAAIER